jgi:ATP-dependent Lon protease
MITRGKRIRIVPVELDSSDEEEVLKVPRIEEDTGNAEDDEMKGILTSSSSEESDDTDDDTEDEEDERKVQEMVDQLRPDLMVEFQKVMDHISQSEPNIFKVLEAKISIEDKTKLFRLYEILKECRYPSFDYESSREHFIDEFKKAQQRSPAITEEKKRLDKLIERPSLDVQIVNMNASDAIKAVIYRESTVMSKLSSDDDEKIKLERWINTCLSLPYQHYKSFPFHDNREKFLLHVKNTLDQEVYGLEKVKEQILLFVNAKISNPALKGCNLGLIGDPGVGKTSIARVLAKCLDYPFSQISCGGMNNADVLKGSAYTYIGSRPGAVVTSLIEMGCNNGIIFLDEFDKISKRPEVNSTMLHLLDPVQNSEFRDNYTGPEIPLNLSGVWFVLAMNREPSDSALRDRLFIVPIPGYSKEEKAQIVKRHLLPKALTDHKIPFDQISFTPEGLNHFVDTFSGESGVRTLNHNLRDLVSKASFLSHSSLPVSFRPSNFSFPLKITSEVIDEMILERKEKGGPPMGMYN